MCVFANPHKLAIFQRNRPVIGAREISRYERISTPRFRNVDTSRVEPTSPPRAPRAPLHSNARISAPSTKSANFSRFPVIPGGTSVARRTAPERPSPNRISLSRISLSAGNAPSRRKVVLTAQPLRRHTFENRHIFGVRNDELATQV